MLEGARNSLVLGIFSLLVNLYFILLLLAQVGKSSRYLLWGLLIQSAIVVWDATVIAIIGHNRWRKMFLATSRGLVVLNVDILSRATEIIDRQPATAPELVARRRFWWRIRVGSHTVWVHFGTGAVMRYLTAGGEAPIGVTAGQLGEQTNAP
jgi:hypothetical protein